MQREIVRITPNTPAIVKLDFGPEGIEREGKFGVQYQYTLNDDCGVMWLPAEGRNALIRSGAEAGDSVRILKTAKGFDVRVISDAAELEAGEPEPEPEPEPERKPPARIHTPGKLPAKLYDTNGRAVAAPAKAPARPAETWPLAEVSKSLFRVAVEVLADAKQYAAEIGLDIEPTANDVNKLGMSFLIQRSRNGGNR